MLQKIPPPSFPTSKNTTTTTIFYTLFTTSIILSLLFIHSLTTTTTTTTNNHLFHHHITTSPTTSLAYFITGSTGDTNRIYRLLLSIYHPKNIYLLHIDHFAPQTDRDRLALKIQSLAIIKAAQNVHVVGRPDFVYSKGSSPLSSFLRGASILLRLSTHWNWFINLSANHYPLVTQDDLLHILSFLPKDLNFVNHTSYIGYRESQRLKPIIVDPGLYLSKRAHMIYTTKERDLPNAYRLFSGSSASILNRKFVEFCILGSDNLPRILMMYLANTPSSILSYIPTVLCNSQEFKETVVNHNLQYTSYITPSKEDPKHLNAANFDDMIKSGSAFATQFRLKDSMLNRIDREILGREPGKVVPGGWCIGEPNDRCAIWGNADILRPGLGAKRLEKRIVELLSNGTFRAHQCIVE